MSQTSTWSFILMFIRRWFGSSRPAEINKLDIVTRLIKEIELCERLDYKKYKIRTSSKVQINVFSDSIVDLIDWCNIACVTIDHEEYVPDRWKVIKKEYGRLPLDEYFSDKGFDVSPMSVIPILIPRLEAICAFWSGPETPELKVRRIYYLRHFKPVLEDGIEVLSHLRAVLK